MITKWSHQKYNAHTLPFAEERDAPDVAPLDKSGLASKIRNENFDEASGGWSASPMPGKNTRNLINRGKNSRRGRPLMGWSTGQALNFAGGVG